jgi:hypothetical protein
MAYGAPLVLCALVYALAGNYFRTYDQARQRTAELERRVQERTRELEDTHERLRALERAATLAAERERLMGDMHDGMGSQLITTLEAVERGSGDAREVAGLLRGCLDDLRLLIDSLDPPEHSLQLALGNLRYRWSRGCARPASRWMGSAGWPAAAGRGHRPAVAAIVQEAVTNAVKHAGATRCGVRLVAEGKDWCCRSRTTGAASRRVRRPVPPSAQRGVRACACAPASSGGILDLASGRKAPRSLCACRRTAVPAERIPGPGLRACGAALMPALLAAEYGTRSHGQMRFHVPASAVQVRGSGARRRTDAQARVRQPHLHRRRRLPLRHPPAACTSRARRAASCCWDIAPGPTRTGATCRRGRALW